MAISTENWVCPVCGTRVDIAPLGLYAEVQCPSCAHAERVHAQLGNFRLEGVLGVGGMSVVYRAIDVVLNRPLAIKVLNDTFRDEPERIERFENESAMMARVRHENVTSVYSAGRAFGQFYIAMELVEGTNLEHMVTAQQPMNALEALTIIRSVAQGLEAAHKAGLLHRDMKPGNILITPEGQAKVIDFGLAVDSQEGDTEEIIWATPYYVPPETLQRKPEDVRTDIYALGMTLRYLLTGVESFEGPTDSLSALLACKRKLPGFAKQVPDAPGALCDLVDHMTKFSTDDRPENYPELIEEIDEVYKELEKMELLRTDPLEDKRVRVRVALWSIAVSFALGLMLAMLIHPTKVTVHQETVEMEPGAAPQNELALLDEALKRISNKEYFFAIQMLLDLSRRTEEPCLGAWSAQLARTLIYAATSNTNQAQMDEAQALLSRHLANKSNLNLAGENFLKQMTEIIDMRRYPSESDWESGHGDWETITRKELQDKMGRLPNVPSQRVIKLVEWFFLSEQSVWIGEMGFRQKSLEKVNYNLYSSEIGPYRPLAILLRDVIEKRAHRPVSTSPLEQARNQLKRQDYLKSAEQLASLEVTSSLSESERAICVVLKQVCTVGQYMHAVVNRHYPGRIGPGMSAEQIANSIPNEEAKILRAVSDSSQADNRPEMAIDGKDDTRWCATDMNSGHYLEVELAAPISISHLNIKWEHGSTLSVKVTADGPSGTMNKEVVKNSPMSRIDLGGMRAKRIRLTISGTGPGNWAGMRELNIIPNAPFFRKELLVLGLIAEGDYARAQSELQKLAAMERPEAPFVTVAQDWLKKLTSTKIEPNTAELTELRKNYMKAYEERPTDPMAIINLCENCLASMVNPGKTVMGLNVGNVSSNQGIIAPKEIIRSMEKQGLVTVNKEKVVAILGIKGSRYNTFSLQIGTIQPCPQDTAQYFDSTGAGKILHTEKDVEAVRHLLSNNPFPTLLTRKYKY